MIIMSVLMDLNIMNLDAYVPYVIDSSYFHHADMMY